MAPGVSWCVKHFHFEVSKLPGLAISQSNVNARNAPLVCLGSNNSAVELAFQLLIASSVVPVVMCVQDEIKLQPSASHMMVIRSLSFSKMPKHHNVSFRFKLI